jgi:hypothetical protein
MDRNNTMDAKLFVIRWVVSVGKIFDGENS